MPTVVLCYHSNNVNGLDYSNNDHIALQADLETLARHRIPVHRLTDVVANLQTDTLEPGVAITFDDGSWFDWYDLEHPSLGMQRSFSNVIADVEAAYQYRLPATSFVIVSPEARRQLDKTCLIGKGWWGEEWWPEAVATGRLDIESHSWDHQHDTLTETATGLAGGTFKNVCSHFAADVEIRQASDYLDDKLGRRTTLLAYPYGDYTDYLTKEYLPNFEREHRLAAAFTTEPTAVDARSDKWKLGRFVCGQHWRSPAELRGILRVCAGIRY